MNRARHVRMNDREFIATGDIISDAVGGKWHNPSGAYNVALKDNLTELSVSDDWAEARKEWKATGNVWYIPLNHTINDVLPEPHNNAHPHECICGHKIAWHFEIENTENGRLEIVGSEHIGFWMIVRHLIENLNIPEDMVTQERVKEWITEAVKSMKAEWWWKTHGEQFEEWFNAVKELDLIINTRKGKTYWDTDTGRNEHQILLRKKSEGTLGTPDYQMASIVWRWNHPDNDKTAQINTRGYPNDRLWNDLMIFYFNLEKHQNTFDEMNREREERVAHIVEERRQAAERRRLEQERWEEQRRVRREEANAREEEQQRLKDAALETFCQDNEINEFSADNGRNDWEKSFLREMIYRINNLQYLSEKQRRRVIKIINREDEKATEKQLAYIRKLGGTPNQYLTKGKASKLIEELLEGDKNEV
ncbi:MAG: hypothetical protein GOVbin556_32 [Prokaryotic dsDNA virus sp.]|nr:MAG: hypothetical protein GOVbin556_32 [Prokaryotic dsDNA virus sp.]